MLALRMYFWNTWPAPSPAPPATGRAARLGFGLGVAGFRCEAENGEQEKWQERRSIDEKLWQT